jgi:hypothetical protein
MRAVWAGRCTRYHELQSAQAAQHGLVVHAHRWATWASARAPRWEPAKAPLFVSPGRVGLAVLGASEGTTLAGENPF